MTNMAAYIRSSCLTGGNRQRCFSKISLDEEMAGCIDGVYEPPFHEREHKIVGYCKGLYCLEYENGTSLLWNPCKNEFKFLPPSELKTPPCPSPNCPVIDCSVCSSSTVCGLGFDWESADYKVLRVAGTFYDHGRVCYCVKQAEVYSLIHNSWEEISIEGEQFHIVDECATYLHGCGYWLGHTTSTSGLTSDQIISFDFSSHQFSAQSLPLFGGFSFDEYGYILTKYEKTLAVIRYDWRERRGRNLKSMFCWVRRASSEWVKKIDYNISGAERPLGFCGDFMLYAGSDGGLLVYDSHQTLFMKIEGIHDYPHCMSIFPFIKSKVLLKPSKWPLRPHKGKGKGKGKKKMMTADDEDLKKKA